MLNKITKNQFFLITDFNINITFKVISISFIKMRKLIYTMAKTKKSIFAVTSFIKSNISFTKKNSYTVL